MGRDTGITGLFLVLTWTSCSFSLSTEADLPAEVTTDIPWSDDSCLYRCDESYFPGRACYCNEACDQYENCCFDYYSLCRPDFVWTDEWLEYEGHEYKYLADEHVSLTRAEQGCQQHGGMLASIQDQQEADFISLSVLRKRTLSVFIGGQEIDGEWQWADGSPMPMPTEEWHQWYDGQPDNSDGAKGCSVLTNYMFWSSPMFMINRYIWRSFSCEINARTIQGYVCERTLLCEPNPCQNNGSCQYVGGENEYECLCQEGYVGNHCQYQLIEGEIWRECGDTNMVAGSDAMLLTSPLYPQTYPPNTQCEWLISTEKGKTLKFELDVLDMELGKDCVFDNLTIYDGIDKENDPILLGPICGANDYLSLKQLSSSFTSANSEVTVVFNTDQTRQAQGFALSYATEVCGQGTGSSGCGSKGLFTAQCGTILLETGPQQLDAPCEVVIMVPEGQLVNLTFNQFNIFDSGKSCADGGLQIYDGSEVTSNNLIGSYCGFRFPWSLQTRTNHVTFRLWGAIWQEDYGVNIAYNAIEKVTWSQQTPKLRHVVSLDLGDVHTVDTTTYLANIHTGEQEVYRFSISGQPGQKIHISNIAGTWTDSDTFKVYNGVDSSSRLLADLGQVNSNNVTTDQDLVSTSFKIYVIFERAAGSQSGVQFTLKTNDYSSELSGCYRPYYSDRADESTTALENHLVTSQKPVVVMVSDQAVGNSDPGYDSGLNCKWTIRGEPGKALSLKFLDANIPPLSENCDHDGVVVYDGNNMHGPFCGSGNYDDIMTRSSEVRVVFYSDTVSIRRHGGNLRILVLEQVDTDNCPVYQMESGNSMRFSTDCGTVLSPNFPGMVPPGLWSWTMEGLDVTQHYVMYVHYVRGPGVKDDCNQHLKIIEVPHDSSVLKQIESAVMTVCGSTELFIPPKRIMLPPYQKLGIELNTLSNSIPYRWEFKLSFARATMEPPQISTDTYECGEGYTNFGGSCYKYFPWVYRHYEDEYSWQQTWQRSMEHCHSQENATLINIRDEDEAYFIKYMLTTAWFWDKAGTVQTSGRLIFIGLHNKYGRYQWTDGTQLSYADWYVPRQDWEQSILQDHTIGTEFLDLKNPQPTADVGSLCSAMLVTSPFDSLSWTKVPCDYPIFRSGVICEKPASVKQGAEEKIPQVDPISDMYANETCPSGYFMVHGTCLQLLTNYDVVRQPMTAAKWTYDNGSTLCHVIGGVMASVDLDTVHKLKDYLRLWRHDVTMGHIWVDKVGDIQKIIKVYKEKTQDEITHYELTTMSNEDITLPSNVLCQTQPIAVEEGCKAQEFQCGDLSCVTVDSVCDGLIDCPDMEDEQNCECTEETFQCTDGQCIPISLYCDFREHCLDGSDEHNCVLRECDSGEFRCHSGQCISDDKLCDFTADCTDASDEDSITCEGQCRGMQCFSGTCIPSGLQSDLVSDCPGLTAEDEVQRSSLTFFELYKEGQTYDNVTEYVGCDDGHMYVPCREGEPRCYPRSSTCIYDTIRVDDGAGLEVQATCRDGAHLRNLCGDMECPGMFHCPSSYCVPTRKVCDGLNDCPDGADEINCQNYTCPGMFRCKGESFCISHSEVCDGVVHCPRYGDDEKYCSSRSSRDVSEITDLCVSGCNCTGNIVECTGAQLMRPLEFSMEASNTKALLLSGNRFGLHQYSLMHLKSLGRLVLKYNDLKGLPLGLFVNSQNLFDLDLSYNLITELQPNVFQGLLSLKRLNLHHNLLFGLQRDTLLPMVQINHLIITDNLLSDVQQDVFDGIPTLKELNSNAYKFCCIAPQASVCTPEADEFSSCKDLMANSTLQVAIWVLGIIACVGNFFVVIWRMQEKTKLVSSFFIINLGVSDFLMGVYLMIIASVDVNYRGEYILHADWWMSSYMCQFAGILAMWSSEVSVFMLTAITADRVLNIIFPLKFGNMRMRHARIVVMCGWITCLFLSIIPAVGIPYFDDTFFGRTGVCLPFQVTNEKVAGWEYSLFIFLVLNLISFIMILIGYSGIFWKVRKSIKKMENKSTSNADEYKLAKKLMIIVATDFFCWVPIILIGFSALGGASISPQVSAWIAVFILPLNSAVNPLLYTIAAMDCKKNKKKRRGQSSVPADTASTAVSGASHARRQALVPSDDTGNDKGPKLLHQVGKLKEAIETGRLPDKPKIDNDASENLTADNAEAYTNGAMILDDGCV